MSLFTLSSAQVADFHRDGFVLVKGFCSKEETQKMYRNLGKFGVNTKKIAHKHKNIACMQKSLG